METLVTLVVDQGAVVSASGGGRGGSGSGTRTEARRSGGRAAELQVVKAQDQVRRDAKLQQQLRQKTTRSTNLRQRVQASLLKKQGFNVSTDKSGNIKAQDKNKTVLIKRSGSREVIATIPKSSRSGAKIIERVNLKTKKVEARQVKPNSKLTKFQKEVRDIRELEKQAAKRSTRAADIFRAVPGLRGDNFAQQTARALLAIPARATVGVGEQAVIAGFKLAATGRARRLGLEVRAEEKRAAKAIPKTIASGFDPRTPEGLANIIAAVVAFKFSKASTKSSTVSTSAAKAGIKISCEKVGQLKVRVSPATKKVLANAAKKARQIAKSPNKIKSIKGKAQRMIGKAKAAVKQPKINRLSRKRLATEKARRLAQNRVALKTFKDGLRSIKKLKKKGAVEKSAIKATARKVRGIQKRNAQLLREINELGFSATKLIKGIKKIPKVKPGRVRIIKKGKTKVDSGKGRARRIRAARKRTAKRSQEKTIARLIFKGKKKLTPSTPTRIRKLVRQLQRQAAEKAKRGRAKAPLRRAAGIKKKRMAQQEQRDLARAIARERAKLKRDAARSKQMVEKLRKAKTKKQHDKIASGVRKLFGDKKGQLLKLKLMTRGKITPPKINNAISNLIATTNALIFSINRAAARSKFDTRAIPVIGTDQKPKADTKADQRGKQDTKPKQTPEEVVEVKAKQQLKQRTATQQIQFIRGILLAGGILGAALLRTVPTRVTKQTLQQSLPRYRRAFFAFFRSKRFTYSPDLAAKLFGQRASRVQVKALLARGRIFTGSERRLLVKR